MSQQNVEIVRAMTEAGRGSEAVGRIAREEFDLSFFFDPEIELDATGAKDVFGDVPDIADVYRGEGIRTFWRRWYEAWRDVQFDVQDYLDAGDEVVVLICNQRQLGRYSGIPSELPPYALVYTFRNDKVVRWRIFPDHDSALKAVGLAE